MVGWKSALNADPTEWLLEPENPSVRYFTLTEILELPAWHAQVAEARAAIMAEGPVPRILAEQSPGGRWGKAQDFYVHSKYRGTVWQLLVLAELGANAEDERVRRACEFILGHSQHAKSGGFAYRSDGRGGDPNRILPCLTGNVVWALIRLGYGSDPRVAGGVQWITRYQRFDDGVEQPPEGWPYDGLEKCWGKHTCHMGVVKALKALAEIPADQRTKSMKGTLAAGAEYLFQHHVYRRSHGRHAVARKEWLLFGFPLMWNTDALEILGILTRLGSRDARMHEAVDLVISKQDSQGRWTLQSTFNGRFVVNIERVGHPSKWITLHALTVLKRFLG
jgi:hypothetical protein